MARRGDSSGGGSSWSMSSLTTLLPESPSPICSSCRSSSPAGTTSSSSSTDNDFYSHFSTALLSPGKQSSASNESNFSRPCPSTVDIVTNAVFESENYEGRKIECSPKWLSTSPMKESSATATGCGRGDNLQLTNSRSCESSDSESPIDERFRLMGRPKPYHEFLEGIKRQNLEEQKNAWKKAKYMKYMNKLRAKEALINDWESKQTRKAMDEMNKLESKLAMKRGEGLARTMGKIARIQRRAEKKKARERESTMERISIINKVSDRIQSFKCLIWLKLLRIC